MSAVFSLNLQAAREAGFTGTPRHTPEQRDAVIAHLRAQGDSCKPAELRRVLGLPPAATRSVLDDLCELGVIRRQKRGMTPWIERVDLDVRPSMVKEALKAPLLDFLTGRRELLGTAARQLHEDADFVLETAKVLAQEGQLRLVPLGASFLLERSPTLVTRLDPLAPLPQSEAARFQAELARVRQRPEVKTAATKWATKPSATPLPGPSSPPPDLTLTRPRAFLNSRSGRLSAHNLKVLRVLVTGGHVRDVQAALGVSYRQARGHIRGLLGPTPYLTRNGPVYQTSAQGLQVLAAADAPTTCPAPPAGPGWNERREAWLRASLDGLGLTRCAQALHLSPGKVWARARRLGLVPGQAGRALPLSTLARQVAARSGLSAREAYPNLHRRAQRAGVLRRVPSPAQASLRLVVPRPWAKMVEAERTPPGPKDLPLRELIQTCGLSRSQLRRLLPTYLRTPPGEQPQLHVNRAEAAAFLLGRAELEAPRPVIRRSGVETVLRNTGANGLTVRELRGKLNLSRAALRFHLQDLSDVTDLYGQGTSLSPYIYRHADFRGETPPQRFTDTHRWGRPCKVARPLHATETSSSAAVPPPTPQTYVTLELERALKAALPPSRRRLKGETARVARHYGLSLRQVRAALARIDPTTDPSNRLSCPVMFPTPTPGETS